MKQIEFIWKMKMLGLNVVQSDDAVVHVNLADDVVLEHQYLNRRDMLNLIIDMGTDDEIDIVIDNDADKFKQVMDLYDSNSTKEDYIKAFKK